MRLAAPLGLLLIVSCHQVFDPDDHTAPNAPAGEPCAIDGECADGQYCAAGSCAYCWDRGGASARVDRSGEVSLAPFADGGGAFALVVGEGRAELWTVPDPDAGTLDAGASEDLAARLGVGPVLGGRVALDGALRPMAVLLTGTLEEPSVTLAYLDDPAEVVTLRPERGLVGSALAVVHRPGDLAVDGPRAWVVVQTSEGLEALAERPGGEGETDRAFVPLEAPAGRLEGAGGAVALQAGSSGWLWSGIGNEDVLHPVRGPSAGEPWGPESTAVLGAARVGPESDVGGWPVVVGWAERETLAFLGVVCGGGGCFSEGGGRAGRAWVGAPPALLALAGTDGGRAVAAVDAAGAVQVYDLSAGGTVRFLGDGWFAEVAGRDDLPLTSLAVAVVPGSETDGVWVAASRESGGTELWHTRACR